MSEQGVMESLSANSLGNPGVSRHLYLRRRIFCAWYTFSSDIVKGQHFDLLFHELTKNFIEKEYLAQQYEKDALLSIATLLYLAFTKIESSKKAMEILR
jgi:hypothetical protein